MQCCYKKKLSCCASLYMLRLPSLPDIHFVPKYFKGTYFTLNIYETVNDQNSFAIQFFMTVYPCGCVCARKRAECLISLSLFFLFYFIGEKDVEHIFFQNILESECDLKEWILLIVKSVCCSR